MLHGTGIFTLIYHKFKYTWSMNSNMILVMTSIPGILGGLLLKSPTAQGTWSQRRPRWSRWVWWFWKILRSRLPQGQCNCHEHWGLTNALFFIGLLSGLGLPKSFFRRKMKLRTKYDQSCSPFGIFLIYVPYRIYIYIYIYIDICLDTWYNYTIAIYFTHHKPCKRRRIQFGIWFGLDVWKSIPSESILVSHSQPMLLFIPFVYISWKSKTKEHGL